MAVVAVTAVGGGGGAVASSTKASLLPAAKQLLTSGITAYKKMLTNNKVRLQNRCSYQICSYSHIEEADASKTAAYVQFRVTIAELQNRYSHQIRVYRRGRRGSLSPKIY